MSVLSPLSENESAPEALDIFKLYPNQVAIQNFNLEDIRPVSQFTGVNAPLEFETSLQGDTYCELPSCRLFLRVRILNADGTRCGDDVKISPCDSFFHSMFKKVDVYMNRTLVSTTGDLYPYKCYFNTLFRRDLRMGNGKMAECQLFSGNDDGFPAETNPNAGNYGLFKRYSVSRGSRPFDMVGLPLNDLMELDRYLINGVHLRLVLHRNSSDFCLISGEDNDQAGYQVKIEDAFLRLMKVKVNPAILLAHSKLLKTVTAKYPYIRSETKCANIASGQSVFSWDHINPTYLPKFVIVTFVDSAAVLGSLNLNPFNMEHFDLRQICLYMNGVACAGNPVSVNYGEDLTAEVLDRIYGFKKARPVYTSMAGISDKDREVAGISRSELKSGRALYVFDLSPVIDEGFHFELQNSGTLSLHAKFGSSLAQNVACILYAEYDALMEIDESRVVKVV